MHLICVILVVCLLSGFAFPTSTSAQPRLPSSLQEKIPEEELKERKNAWTVGVMTGQLGGTYPRIGHELSKVLNDGNNLRVIAMLAYGAASNLEDLLYLKGVDIAITQADVFEYFLKKRNMRDLPRKVRYILRLYDAETHILARREIRSLADLRGRKVAFGPVGNSASLTGPILFNRLGIGIEPVFAGHAAGLEMMKSGEVAAVVRVFGKPARFFSDMKGDTGFHFLAVPFTANMSKLEDYYSLAELTHTDYPLLIPEGEAIETISVPNVLAVYNWPKDSNRYQRVARFTEALFEKWEAFKQPQFHPKWREINLAANVPGWTRLDAADEMLRRMGSEPGQGTDDLQAQFRQFHEQRPDSKPSGTEESLFREFLEWRASRP